MSNAVKNLPILNKESEQFGAPVVIVGGGPAGLATALMLAKRGWTNITILEKRPSADYYEPDKSFNYLIDGRGQKMTDFLGITEKLSQISVPNNEFQLTTIESNGSKKTSKLPIIDSNRKPSYWLPRKVFLQLLYEEIEQNWSHHIKVLFNTKCLSIEKSTPNDSGRGAGSGRDRSHGSGRRRPGSSRRERSRRSSRRAGSRQAGRRA